MSDCPQDCTVVLKISKGCTHVDFKSILNHSIRTLLINIISNKVLIVSRGTPT